jgi:putative Holliday junction resolvase
VPALPSLAETVLAFDYGERYIGIAVGDTETRLAHPIGHVDALRDAVRFERIESLVREWRPDRLVVGLPLSLDGAEHALSARARRFARQLAARCRLPVDLADERLTSACAEEMLRAAGRGGRAAKNEVHALAAQVILQSYFDEKTP